MKMEDIVILVMAGAAVFMVIKSGKTTARANYATSPATIQPGQVSAGVPWYQDPAPQSWLDMIDTPAPSVRSGSLFNTGMGGGYLTNSGGASGGW